MSHSEEHARSRNAVRRRWSLGSLFRLQPLVVPVFMAPVLYRLRDANRPYALLLAFVGAPVVYVGLLTYMALRRRARAVDSRSKRSLSGGIIYGAAFSLVFFACGVGPLVATFLWQAIERFAADARQSEPELLWYLIRGGLIEPVAAVLLVATTYAVLGAAVGGVIGIVMDRNWTRYERSRHRLKAIEPAVESPP